MSTTKPKIKCACSCGYKHHNAVPCTIQTIELTLPANVLDGSHDLIIEVFLLDGAVGTTGTQGPLITYTSQFSAISLTQGKNIIYVSLNDSTGSLSPTSTIQWTMQTAPAPSVEQYRLHVGTLPAPIVTTIESRFVFQFWRQGTFNGRSRHQALSKRCAEVVSVVAN
jgi:hypothetical protein